MSKQIFFKTVRSTGESVHAIGKFNRTYEVGKRYRFPKAFPAHVYLPRDKHAISSDQVYKDRPEGSYGNRVLICYGEVKLGARVPRFPVNDDWHLENIQCYTTYRDCSTDFVVVGEIEPSFPRPVEHPKNTCKVVGSVKKSLKINL